MEDEARTTAEQVLSRLDDGDTGECAYVLTTGTKGAGMRLVACQGNRTWVLQLAASDLECMAREAGLLPDEFKRETERALARRPRATETFVYSIASEREGLRLAWKRHLLPDNIKFQLGRVLLKEEEAAPTLGLMMDHAVSHTLHLQHQISQLERVNSRLTQERMAALAKLEQSTLTKEEVERDLYSKFKLVLNEKKNKIRRLMDGHAPVEDSHTHGAAEEKGRTTKGPSLAAATPEKRQSALLGEADEVVSPPTRRRKREATHRATADIPKPPSFPSPHTSAKNTTDPSSSTDGDDLLHLL